MSRRLFTFPGRVVCCLVGMAFIAASTGCAPKIPAVMSDLDFQACDDTAATIEQKLYFYVYPYQANWPFMVKPGEAEITSPLSGGIFPYGEPVNVTFTQPPLTPLFIIVLLNYI